MQQHDERVYGDTTECAKCGKQWDTNDIDPPPCLTAADYIKQIREKLRGKNNE